MRPSRVTQFFSKRLERKSCVDILSTFTREKVALIFFLLLRSPLRMPAYSIDLAKDGQGNPRSNLITPSRVSKKPANVAEIQPE
jgi:hypothetical protein